MMHMSSLVDWAVPLLQISSLDLPFQLRARVKASQEEAGIEPPLRPPEAEPLTPSLHQPDRGHGVTSTGILTSHSHIPHHKSYKC